MKLSGFIRNVSSQTAMCGIFAMSDSYVYACVNSKLSTESVDFPFLYTKEILWKNSNI